MNYAMVLKNLGILLICETLAMIPSLLVSIGQGGNDAMAFVYTMALTGVLGILTLIIKPKNKNLYARDGFAVAAIGWILISFFGALPFVFSGAIPSLIDAFFEASSGFTTTGASILRDVEVLPRGILFWRSFTHWIGGMGVLVLTMALLPSIGSGSFQMMKAESPGPTPGKLVPKLRQTAKILYGIYIIITIVEILILIIAGMPIYDAAVHTFGTVGTGGFGIKNLSVGAYNNAAVDIIITVFMFICGANFALYYQAIKGRSLKAIFKDEEFRIYGAIVVVSILAITFNINGIFFKSFWESLRHAAFQVSSIITTTGYSTTDFNLWPTLSKLILFFLMFIGGCAGSTAGAIKNVRVLLIFRMMKRDLIKIIHPRAVYTVKFNGKSVDEETLSEVAAFFFMYMVIYVFEVLIVSLDGFDIVTTLSSVTATLGNIGPGLGLVGPLGNFADLSYISKFVLSIGMIIGRLEIYPILLLMIPSFWKRVTV